MEKVNRLEAEKKQYEDNVHQLENVNISKDQQLQEALGHLQDVQQQLDSAKVLAWCAY